jgi:hypothetical protein
MVAQRKMMITESERNRIKSLYGISPVMENIVITNWLSPDEKYCIFLDELYDLKENLKIGNIWENFDNFKFFLKHSFEVATNVPQQIKESVLESINSFVLTESTQNITLLKPYLKQILNENVVSDFGNWVKDTAVGTVKGIGDFITTGYEGLKKLGISISEGDWKNVVNLLKKGALYVARKIREALYSPVGMILDAILVASGVGVGFKMLPWAIVVALDIYEFMTGNYEDPDLSMGWRLLFFGVDILGLVTSGVLAKTSRSTILNLIGKFGKSEKGLQVAVKNSPKLKSFLQRVLQSTTNVGGHIKKTHSYLKTKSPLFYGFFSNIISGVSNFIGKLVSYIGKILNAPGKLVSKIGGGSKSVAAANVAVPSAVIGTYQKGQETRNNNTGVTFNQSDFSGYEINPNEF